jgi:uncharacterized membrane protein YebE (DUF533 family)
MNDRELTLARLAADLLLALVGAAGAREHVDEAERRNANAIADAAEKAKFPNG